MAATVRRHWLLVGGLAASLIFVAVIAVVFVALRPVGSAFTSGVIGAAVAGVVWWVFFMRLAASLERRSRRHAAE